MTYTRGLSRGGPDVGGRCGWRFGQLLREMGDTETLGPFTTGAAGGGVCRQPVPSVGEASGQVLEKLSGSCLNCRASCPNRRASFLGGKAKLGGGGFASLDLKAQGPAVCHVTSACKARLSLVPATHPALRYSTAAMAKPPVARSFGTRCPYFGCRTWHPILTQTNLTTRKIARLLNVLALPPVTLLSCLPATLFCCPLPLSHASSPRLAPSRGRAL
eukprot:362322-Chlamydomonas_euryale.AAC.17